jgi:hypothetical protein
MKIRHIPAIVFGLVLSAATFASTAAFAQDAPPPPPSGPDSASGPGPNGEHAGMRHHHGDMDMGIFGTVTEAAADHYTVKTDAGESYTVRLSADTHIVKQTAERRQKGENPPQKLSPTDIVVGDVIDAHGEVDAMAKSVDAHFVVKINPERIQQIRQMRADYGKTWLMGKVTAIDGNKITLLSMIDNTTRNVETRRNTIFRKHHNPIKLADVKVDDHIRAKGSMKDGRFVATAVNVMGMPPEGTPMAPNNAPPTEQSK